MHPKWHKTWIREQKKPWKVPFTSLLIHQFWILINISNPPWGGGAAAPQPLWFRLLCSTPPLFFLWVSYAWSDSYLLNCRWSKTWSLCLHWSKILSCCVQIIWIFLVSIVHPEMRGNDDESFHFCNVFLKITF